MQNNKLRNYTQEKDSTQSKLLTNSIVFTNNVQAGNDNGLEGTLLQGEISFNKNTMKLNTKYCSKWK
ncbi:hypothetical protein [Clostridium massiliamazoniense]|uniref:hypothetical protein n=1 Tax=Clostridium massiliamazoniense TaxID=1347366 RepID=UPI0006D813B7|nr:hypothetical protein [Clostridium massiliamazoniense]